MKKFLLIFFSIVILILSLISGLLYYVSKKTSRPFTYFPKLIFQSLSQNSAPEKLNIMILGVDRRNDLLEKTETTDTIIFSQINFLQNQIHLFSLPRDLWDYYTNTKINQLYPISLTKTNSIEKFDFLSQNFASISGQKIDKTVILSTENLKQLADLVGGIDIYLENGFVDKKYPNQAYIDNPKSGAPIYKTIEFAQGWNHLDSSNITEFVRSRKSSESAATGGTDLGRIARQQQLINSLLDKVKYSLQKNPQLVFKYYQFWSSLEHNFTDADLFSYLIKYNLKLINLTIVRHSVSAGEDQKTNLLYHPTKFINLQWVFIPQDNNYQGLHQYISQSLLSP